MTAAGRITPPRLRVNTKRRVRAAEGEAGREGARCAGKRSGRAQDEIEPEVGVHLAGVRHRMDLSTRETENGGHRLGRPRRSEKMSDERFGRRDGDLAEAEAEDRPRAPPLRKHRSGASPCRARSRSPRPWHHAKRRPGRARSHLSHPTRRGPAPSCDAHRRSRPRRRALAIGRAPRAAACAAVSSTSTPAPSPNESPRRSLSKGSSRSLVDGAKGVEARIGELTQRVRSARERDVDVSATKRPKRSSDRHRGRCAGRRDGLDLASDADGPRDRFARPAELVRRDQAALGVPRAAPEVRLEEPFALRACRRPSCRKKRRCARGSDRAEERPRRRPRPPRRRRSDRRARAVATGWRTGSERDLRGDPRAMPSQSRIA